MGEATHGTGEGAGEGPHGGHGGQAPPAADKSGFGSPDPAPRPHGALKKLEIFTEGVVFGSRWIQAPLYVGLIIAELVYAYRFAAELWHLVTNAKTLEESDVIISVLGLVDITMVANLIAMIVIGGYATFVSKLNVDAHEDRPDWLDKIDAATMKIKLAASLVGISSIHLLKAFIDMTPARHAAQTAHGAAASAAAHVTAVAQEAPNLEVVKYQIIIHAMFLISAVMLALSERILHGPPHHDH